MPCVTHAANLVGVHWQYRWHFIKPPWRERRERYHHWPPTSQTHRPTMKAALKLVSRLKIPARWLATC